MGLTSRFPLRPGGSFQRKLDIGRRMTVSIQEAQTDLSALLEKAANGQEIIIEDAGQPVARLVGVSPDVAAERTEAEVGDDSEDPVRRARVRLNER